MKIPGLKKIFAAALFLGAATVFSQNSYTIKMNMKIEGLPPEYAAAAEQDITNYIMGDKFKSERVGMMETNTVYMDAEKITSLKDAMGSKTGFSATRAELEANAKNDKSPKPKIEYVNEKKTIAGYECAKALVTSGGAGKENISTIWYTDKIIFNRSGMHKAQGKGMLDLSELKGYPLAMEMSDSSMGIEMKIKMTATEVSTAPVDDSVFKVNTEGYQMMTYKEMQEKQKAMGQGR